jgi:hypothetical protein
MTDGIEPQESGNESLRDVISSAVEAQSKPASPPQEAAPDDGAAPSQPRDDKGRFAVKEPKQGGDLEPASEAEAAPKDEPAAGPPSADAQAQPKPPPGFSVKSKADWDKLPDHIRADIAKREAEIDAGFKRYTGLKKFAEIAEHNGRSLGDAVSDYWQVEQSLRSNFLGGIEAICQRFGVDQRALAAAMAQRYGIEPPQGGQQSPPPQPPQINPQGLIDNALNRFRQEQLEREVNQQIEAFKSDPANRYFENVRPAMQALLAGGQAQTLKEAYDAACWLNPDTRALLLAEQQAKPAQKTAAVTQAKAAAKAVTGAPGPNIKTDSAKLDPNMSVKDTIRAAIAAQMDAA